MTQRAVHPHQKHGFFFGMFYFFSEKDWYVQCKKRFRLFDADRILVVRRQKWQRDSVLVLQNEPDKSVAVAAVLASAVRQKRYSDIFFRPTVHFAYQNIPGKSCGL